jgi:PIN domain nuclease of toxin-antitoxin system
VRLLLDTHAFLWFTLRDPKLSATAKALLSDRSNDLLLSPASFWEIAIKISVRKYDLRVAYDEFMTRAIEGYDLQILPIEPKHTAAVASLPFHHKAPFDRLLIAQALVEGVPLVSIDTAFDAYGVARIW